MFGDRRPDKKKKLFSGISRRDIGSDEGNSDDKANKRSNNQDNCNSTYIDKGNEKAYCRKGNK